jgi:ABC-type nitrate/sulfonate/bicarbonate transport system substrate-binding protein
MRVPVKSGDRTRHAAVAGLAVLGILGLGLVAGCAAAPATAPAAAPRTTLKLKIGTATTPPPALPESTLWLGRELGYYQREGLDVDIVETQATPSVITAMRSGEVDVGNINSEDVIRLAATRDLEMRTINSSKDVPRISATDWADTQFVDSVLKELGVYPKVDDPGRPI